jgi:hypothetical protein
VIESGKVMAQMTNDFLFKPTDIEVENLKHELDAMQYKSAIMREM